MSDSEKDSIEVRDRSSRRRFIRHGAAFVAAGSLVGTTNNVYADDCDRNAGTEKNAEVAGSDNDTGESADPTACGKRPAPKISLNQDSLQKENKTKVAKIKA